MSVLPLAGDDGCDDSSFDGGSVSYGDSEFDELLASISYDISNGEVVPRKLPTLSSSPLLIGF